MTGALEIRRPVLADVPAIRAAHAELAEADGWLFAFEMELDDEAWLANVAFEERGVDLPEHLVRCSYLIGVVGGRVVGRLSLRHELNDHLAWHGGHIGFAVVPGERDKGYATALAREGLRLLAAEGTDVALITCEADNVASATVIERVGGVLRDTIELDDGTIARRYDVLTS